MNRFAPFVQDNILFLTSRWLEEQVQLFLSSVENGVRSNGDTKLVPFTDAYLAIVHKYAVDIDKAQMAEAIQELYAAYPVSAHYKLEDLVTGGTIYSPLQVPPSSLMLCQGDSTNAALTKCVHNRASCGVLRTPPRSGNICTRRTRRWVRRSSSSLSCHRVVVVAMVFFRWDISQKWVTLPPQMQANPARDC